MGKTTAQTTYGTINNANTEADLFLVVKSSSPSGTYGPGTTRKATTPEARKILMVPIQIKLALSSALIKSGNSSPIVFIAAPGAGYAIDILSASIKFVYNGITYAGASGIINLIADTATTVLFSSGGDVLKKTASSFEKLQALTGNPAASQLIENKAIKIQNTNDMTLGDGTATMYATYQIVLL
jgi:hypothetical protein